MTERRMYELTEQQMKKLARRPFVMPSDEEIKTRFAREHHGVTRGWGMLKRDLAVGALMGLPEYQRGLWQGRVDRARGLDYSEERSESAYNLGYHRGYVEYESNRHGWDAQTRRQFDESYVNN